MFGYFSFQIYKRFLENLHKHSYIFLEIFFQWKIYCKHNTDQQSLQICYFLFCWKPLIDISHRHGKKAISYLIDVLNWLINNINRPVQLSDWIFGKLFYQIKTAETLLNADWKFPLDSVKNAWHFYDQIAKFF